MTFPQPVQAVVDNSIAKADPNAAYRPLYNSDYIIGNTIFSARVFTGGVVVVVGKLTADFKPVLNSQRLYHFNVLKSGRLDYYVSTHHKNPAAIC